VGNLCTYISGLEYNQAIATLYNRNTVKLLNPKPIGAELAIPLEEALVGPLALLGL
jgi:hypothetical protein